MRKVLLSISLVLLAGCGGGGGSSTVSTSTGKFIDSAVAGLSYTTTSQSGTTDANGTFQYKSGETVNFKLYEQQILAVPG